MSARLGAVLAVLALARPAAAADVEQAVRDSYGAALQGRYDDAAGGWRYLGTLGAAGARPEANEALAMRDSNRPEEALPLWIKAALQEGADGFVWNQRGWAFLALGRVREAKESFAKAVDRSATTQTQAEANLGLGLAALVDDKPKAALEPLRRAAVEGPYAISASAELTAEAATRLGDKQTALTYWRQALDLDPYDREALRGLVGLLDKIGDNRGAWLAARRALSVDPDDAAARKVLERNARFVLGDPDEASGVRRIPRPVLPPDDDSEPLPKSKRPIRVGLYGAPGGRPATLTRCYVMANSPFTVDAAAYGERDKGEAFDQWQIEYRAETGLVEVRSSAGNIRFVAKQPFTLKPQSARGSVLIKSAQIPDSVGVDLGDREVRGSVEVIPNPQGFRLVEEVPLELYLYGVVSLSLPDQSPPEAWRAQAVVSRTAAVWEIGHRPNTLERVDVLDDHSVQPTIGVSGELRVGGEAVRATEGLVLADKGEVARAPQHLDSGGRTEQGSETGDPGLSNVVSVPDSAKSLEDWRTPYDLERFVHEPPPQGLYSEAAPGPSAAGARWVRLLDAKDLRARVEKRKDVGRLRGLIVTARTATGRVKSLRVVGADGTLDYEGFDAISALLSPGTLRSNLFTLQPLYDGKSLSRVIVWGAGTGTGLGFSRFGALGQAELGRSWREIVTSYFPRYVLRDLDKPEAPPAPKRPVGPYRRKLNFRRAPSPAGRPAPPPAGKPAAATP